MNNNLPLKKEREGVLYKIKLFFEKIFSKKDNNNEILPNDKLVVNSNFSDKKENFNEYLTKTVNNNSNLIQNMDKSSLTKEFEKNPELLNNLSYERLKKLHAHYDAEISDLKNSINGCDDDLFNVMDNKELEKNPELLTDLSAEKLRKIKKYYKGIIETYKKRLAS